MLNINECYFKNVDKFFLNLYEVITSYHIEDKYNFTNLLPYYKKLLINNPYPSDEIQKGYTHNIQLLGSQFNFIWQIRILNQIIKQQHLLSSRFKTSKLFESVDKKNINPLKLANVNSNPVIIGHIPFSSPDLLVLDGNHRVTKAYLNHKHEIKGFLLSADLHLPAMLIDS